MKALYDEGGLQVVLARCEALADGHLRHGIPGRSQAAFHENEGWKTRAVSRVLVAIGYPVERAFDVITIGQKPALEPTASRDRAG
jgi:hypothetical protein